MVRCPWATTSLSPRNAFSRIVVRSRLGLCPLAKTSRARGKEMDKPAILSVDLTGRRVVVTAGAAGIGRAMVDAFLANGARVELCDVDEKALAEMARALPQAGTHRCDVSDAGAVEGFFEKAVERLGGLDVLINNAGIAGPTKRVEEIDEAEWRRTLDVDLTGQFLCARKAIPHLRQAGGGSIINLSSAAGIFAFRCARPIRPASGE